MIYASRIALVGIALAAFPHCGNGSDRPLGSVGVAAVTSIAPSPATPTTLSPATGANPTLPVAFPVETDPNSLATDSNTANPNSTPPPPKLGPSSVAPNSPWITYVGRFDLSNPNQARAAYAGSSVRAQFRGTSLTVSFKDELTTAATDAQHNWFNVYVDGQDTLVQLVSPNAASFVVATNLAADTNHTVTITKRTDPSVGVADFLGMSTSSDGNFLVAPAGASRHIEVIGASETSGYGVDGDTYGCSNSAFYEAFNGDDAYAGQTGDLVNADVINLAYAGKGIVRNYSLDDSVKTLPYMYPRAIPDDPNAPLWNAASWQADVVVLDTGGCDFTIGSPVDPNLFIQTFLTFVQTIRSNYPKAKIIIAMDTLYEDISGSPAYRTQLEGYFQTIISESQDSNIAYFPFPGYTATYLPPVDASGKWGCNGHPDQPASFANGQLLANLLQQALSW